MRNALAFAIVFAASLQAEGTTPREKPADYPLQAAAGNLTIAAEYNVRSFGSGKEAFWSPDYLIVEVAIYSTSREPVKITPNSFTLRLNNQKEALLAQSPNMVAASLKYPDWEYRPHMEAAGGVGDTGVILGRPTPTERFPGDPSTTQRRLPNPPRVPQSTPGGVQTEPAKTPAEVVVALALPEGDRVLPVSGYVYFPFKGKPKNLKSVELVYQGDGVHTTLKLK